MTHGACNHEIKRLENELSRLRAVNAELATALRDILKWQGDPCRINHHGECETHAGGPCIIAEAAETLSRAEQAKPETEKCVWRGDLLHGYQVQCGYRPVFGDGVSTGKCLGCGKRIEVKK